LGAGQSEMRKLPWKSALSFSILILICILLPFIVFLLIYKVQFNTFVSSIVNNWTWLKIIAGIISIFLLLLFSNTKRFRKYFPKLVLAILLVMGYSFILASMDSDLSANIDNILNISLFAAGVTVIAFVVFIAGLLGKSYLNDETNESKNIKPEISGKPILVENLAGMSGNDMFGLIDGSDKVNREVSVKLVSEELRLFNLALRLQYEALAFASSHNKEWTKSDQIVVAMACRVVRQLRAARELMLYGFWAEVQVLERSIHEALTREWYFYKYPEEAPEWFREGSQIKQGKIDKALAEEGEGKSEDDLLQVLRNHYGYISQHTHPNVEAIQLETWDGEGAIGSKGIIAGPITEDYFKIQFQSLLLIAVEATQILGIVGLHDATNTWKQEVSELRDVVKNMGIDLPYKKPAQI